MRIRQDGLGEAWNEWVQWPSLTGCLEVSRKKPPECEVAATGQGWSFDTGLLWNILQFILAWRGVIGSTQMMEKNDHGKSLGVFQDKDKVFLLLACSQPWAASSAQRGPTTQEKNSGLQERSLQKAREIGESKKSHRAARDRGRKDLALGGEKWSVQFLKNLYCLWVPLGLRRVDLQRYGDGPCFQGKDTVVFLPKETINKPKKKKQ